MPLTKGSSKKVIAKNFDELRHGKQFARTAKKFGKQKARDQMIAIALQESGKSKKARMPRRDANGFY